MAQQLRDDNAIEQSTEHKKSLSAQLKEAYGRIVYTYTAHNKLSERKKCTNKKIKYGQIGLSAITTIVLTGDIICNEAIATWVSAISAAILLAINLYFKDFNLAEEIAQHQRAADELWLIKEQYLSLLTDLPELDEDTIRQRRDELQLKTSEIYKQSPKTDAKSYKDAQDALKNADEQFFGQDELDKLLPDHLRSDSTRKLP